jgi:branched-chain amino acid transport system permease protein
LYKLDHLYGLLLTFGLALIIQGLFRNEFGSSGLPYQIPSELTGGINLGFMFLPIYRGWVIVASLVVCFSTWYVIERTKLGSYLRAATENPALVQAFGVNVPRMITLTFGMALIIEGVFRNQFGSSGMPYAPPEMLGGPPVDLGFMFLPKYRLWVVVAALGMSLTTWLVIEKTRLGAYLRAATENPALVQAFGINVPRMVTVTYGLGVALAGFAGVLAAPIYRVSPAMGSDLIIVVFAVVVIGGMGSIMGSIVTGFALQHEGR